MTFMGMGMLLALALVTALYGCYCASRNRRNGRSLRTDGMGRSMGPNLHFVDRRQLAEMYELESHHVLFQIQGSQKEAAELLPGHLGITRNELEKCIPWIPGASRVFLSSPGGFDPSVLKRLRALHSRRDIYLIERQSNDLALTGMMEA